MNSALRTFIDLVGIARLGGFVLLTAIGAATEGFGVVLLVPLVATLTGGHSLAGLPLGLPEWPLPVLLAVFVALVAVRSLVEIARALATQRMIVAVVDGLRRRAVTALLGAEWRALSAMQQSANRALLVTSVDRAGDAVHHFATLVRTAISLLALGLAGLALSPGLALGGILAGLLALLALRGLRRDARHLGEALSRQYETIYLRLEQTLSALRPIKSFGREDAEARALSTAFAGLRTVERDYVLSTTLAKSALQTGSALALAMVVWLAVTRWGVTTPVLLAFLAFAVRAVPLVEALQGAAQGWARASPAFEEADALIRQAEAVAEHPPPADPPRLHAMLSLEHVALDHAPGRTGLLGVSAQLPARQITALVGPSGAGKSTLADIAGGLISPDSGQVTLDGIALAGGLRNAWRSRVAYVQQETVLFTGSVRDNLLWAAPQADEDALHAALERAAASFVHQLPGGLDCMLGEAGRALSGGERQRLALARALLREPDLLILDEATSAIDPASEAAIVEAVRALAGSRTVLVIGHRGALVDCATHRIVLVDGRNAPG